MPLQYSIHPRASSDDKKVSRLLFYTQSFTHLHPRFLIVVSSLLTSLKGVGLPVPKFRQRKGAVPTASHHFINSSVPNSLDSVLIHARSRLFSGTQYCISSIAIDFCLPLWSRFLWSNAVLPVVRRHKISTRIPDNR